MHSVSASTTQRTYTFAMVTLAFWQMRQVWRFFLLVAIGMLASVVLACSLPLFSLVNTTAGVRSTFNNGLFDPTSYVQGNTSLASSPQINLATQRVTQKYRQLTGTFFLPPVRSMVTSEAIIVQDHQVIPNQLLQLHGYDNAHIASRLQLTQGHLPQTTTNNTLEIALSEANASMLHATVGSLFTVYLTPANHTGAPIPIPLIVSGIFHDVSFYDPFWHGDILIPYYDPNTRITHDNTIVNNTALLAFLDRLAIRNGGQPASFSLNLFWYFPLNINAITSTSVDTIPQQANRLSSQIPLTAQAFPYINNITVSNADLLTLVKSAHEQTSTSQVPAIFLLAIMLALILFFNSLMTELLVTRQAETIALTRTRGASLGQIFLTFVTQSLMLGVLTLLVSPFLIMLAVRMLIQLLLPVADQNALNALPTTLWTMVATLGWYLLAAVGIAILAMCAAIWRTLNSNTLGRSSTLEGHYPFWQRYYLDLLFFILGSLTYGLSLYLTTTGIINDQLQVLLAGPCILAAAILLSLAGILLYLRCFPWFLRLGARIAARGRSITPLLSLEIMSRTPRQSMRMALLLIMTIAFAIFSLIFTATQTQRTYDVANYRTGADFSGGIEQSNPSPTQLQTRYQSIPGVLSAAIGFASPYNLLNTPGFTQLIAVDPQSFVSSVIWSQEDPRQSVQDISQMAAHLADNRALFTSNKPDSALPPLPAIIDTATKNQLHISPGQIFYLSSTGNHLALIDVGEVQHIPGIDDAIVQGTSNKQAILVDYASFVPAYERIINNPNDNLSPNTVWLHTRQDTTSHATVRRTLTQSSLALESLTDHQLLLQQLQHDPLYLNLICALTLGVILSLLLAFFGNVTSVWLSVRNRLRSLAVLRALGTSSLQLLKLLAWEQGIIYTTTIILGVLFGLFFTLLTLSSLIFSGTALAGSLSNRYTSAIYFLQFTPPLHVIAPLSLFIALGCTIGLGVITLAIMIYSASRPSLAQILRLSEDYVEEVPVFVDRMPVQTATLSPAPPLKQQSSNTYTRIGWLASIANLPDFWTRMPLRSSWGHQLLITLGIMVSVLLICVVPLFSQVTATAGLREVLTHTTSQYASTQIVSAVNGATHDTMLLEKVPQTIATKTRTLNHILLTQNKPFFHDSPFISIQANVLPATPTGTPPDFNKSSPLEFFGLSQANLSAHVSILQGHLPQSANTLQIALTPEAATYMHVKIDDVLTQKQGYPFTMQVVGIFQPRTSVDAILPSEFLLFTGQEHKQTGIVTALVSSEGFIQADNALMQHEPQNHPWFLGSINWYYRVNQQVTIDQLNTMLATFAKLEQDGTLSQNILPVDELHQYQDSVQIANIPIATTSLLIIGLILLFLNFISELLVEREMNTIAILQSRGATRRQIFSTFFSRMLLLCGAGIIPGLLLVIPLVTVLANMTLLPVDRQAISTITAQPLQSLLSLYSYVLLSIIVTLAALGVSLYRAASTNTLMLRRETSRSTRQPIWQRFYLDVAGLVIALGAYAFSLYLTNVDILSPAVNVQVKSPLVLLATVCLMITCILVFLRLFPSLLRIATIFATRNRGVEPMLAISQMARTPRQSLRIALLLISTTAFVVFASVFAASQTQHIRDVAQYWTGADFSGPLVNPAPGNAALSVQQAYQHLPGVHSVSTGYVSQELNPMNGTTKLIAVDPTSFMHTVNWPELGTSQQKNTVIQQLTSQRSAWTLLTKQTPLLRILPRLAIPALVDAHTWDELQLTRGEVFQLQGLFNYVAIGKVNYIPSSNDSGQTADLVDGQNSAILVDYQSYAIARSYIAMLVMSDSSGRLQRATSPVPDNYVWLSTNSDAHTLSDIRKALSTGPLQLTPLSDRQAIMHNLETDPLNLELMGNLVLGAIASLFLTWLGCLIASWMNARQRALSFGILRALGSTPQQLKKVLLWEQTFVYGTATLLGILLGLLMALLTLPSLILTSKLPQNSTVDLFSLQNTPPMHTVIPASLILVIGLLAALAIVSVWLMNRVVAWVSLPQTLRLNED